MTVKISLNAAEAAEAVGLKEATIKAAVRAGQLRAKRSGRSKREGREGDGVGNYLIAVDDLRAWFEGLPDA